MSGKIELVLNGKAIVGDVVNVAYAPEPEPPTAPYIDITADMPLNAKPDNPDLVKRRWFGWPTDPTVTGITIHHTMSHSPWATAEYHIRPVAQGGKGLPTVQYHYWISASDGCPVYRLVADDVRLWHDHTGAMQTTLSVGMAGTWHLFKPPDEQIAATVELVAYLMQLYGLPVEAVQGHDWRARGAGVTTVCPGWHQAGWYKAFFEALGRLS